MLATCFVIMTIVMALCTIILSIISYSSSIGELSALEFERRAYVDMIGEDFAADGEINGNYRYAAEVNGNTLTVRNGTTILLTVERASGSVITSWKYGA